MQGECRRNPRKGWLPVFEGSQGLQNSEDATVVRPSVEGVLKVEVRLAMGGSAIVV
jgi:hypothetical protein